MVSNLYSVEVLAEVALAHTYHSVSHTYSVEKLTCLSCLSSATVSQLNVGGGVGVGRAAAPPLSNAPTTTLNPLSRLKIRRERTIFGTGALSHLLCRWL